MKSFKRLLALAMAVVLVVASLTGCGGYTSGNEKIKIGAMGPLTGGAAVYGTAVKNSAELAVEEINAKGGLNGMLFELSMLDDKNDPSLVSNNYATLLESGMQVSLGTVTTKPALEYKTLSNNDNVFFITPSASGDDVPEYDNGYQMCFADSNQGVAAANYVNGIYKGQTIGVLYKSDDPYSTGILDMFKETLDSSITLVEASFMGETVASFDAQINTLKNCQFIFMPIYYTPASQFMTQAKGKVADNAVYYGCDGLDGIDGGVEGFDVKTIPQEISYLSHFNSQATEGPAAEFIAKYTAKYDAETLNQFGAAAYDCVYAIYSALEIAIKNGKEITVTTSAEELCTILTEIFNSDDFTFTGITGEYANGVQSTISWESTGYVNKTAVKYTVKAADAE